MYNFKGGGGGKLSVEDSINDVALVAQKVDIRCESSWFIAFSFWKLKNRDKGESDRMLNKKKPAASEKSLKKSEP